MAMFTEDRSLPASALFSAASSLARLSWLKVTEPASAAGAEEPEEPEVPAAGVEEPPEAFFEQAAAEATSRAAAQAAVMRILVPILVQILSETVGVPVVLRWWCGFVVRGAG